MTSQATRCAIFSLSLLGAALGQTAHATPTIYGLGSLVGNTYDLGAFGVNRSNQVVGYSINSNGFYRAFRYDGIPGAGGVMRDLGGLTGSIGHSFGFGINDLGQTTGEVTSSTAFPDHHAFLYTGTPGVDGVMRDLGTLGGKTSQGRSINNSGQVAGYSDLPTDPTGFTPHRAFRYDGVPGAGGVMRDLGTLPGHVDSHGLAINAAGQVAGYSVGIEYHAFRYDGTPGAGGVMHDLGTLGGSLSEATAINDDGQVTGRSGVRDGSGENHAFRYDGTPGQGGRMLDLGTLGGDFATGTGIDSAGNVVGWSRTRTPFDPHAFLYVGTPGAGGKMIDLDLWLDTENPAEGANWRLFSPKGINDSGWITGWGLHNRGQGFVLDPFLLDVSSLVPEPHTGVLVLVGLTRLMIRPKRRSSN